MEKIRRKKVPFYLILCFFSFFIMDYMLRGTYIQYGILELYDQIPLLFVLGWCILLCGIIHMLPGLVKKIFMIVSILFFGVLTLVHAAYINVFYKFFSFADLSLLQEGTDYMDSSYIDIRKRIIIVVVFALLLMVAAVILAPKHPAMKMTAIVGIALIGIGILGVQGAKWSMPKNRDATTWNASNNPSVVYDDFVDTEKNLLMCGLYEYTFRDIWILVNPFDDIQYESTVNELTDYFEEQETETDGNEKTGIFEDKNLILVQLENIDNWMLTEKNMPNLYRLRTEGIDFVNHYSVGFATGKTFNTEFIVNTGYVPQTKGEAPSYIYSKNAYPYSLANLFRNHGYTANSYHSMKGTTYNRSAVHETFGYELYHDYTVMGMDDPTMDSQLTNNFGIMIPSDRFFNFIITYSGHSPFTEENNACKAHIEAVEQEYDDTDFTYLCGLAQARETDLFVANLIKNLEENDLLQNTVLVFYTDHYAYSTIDEEKELELKGTNDPNLLQNTPFFIWSEGIEQETVEKVTNSADILPTLANMFALDCEYQYYVGYDVYGSQGGYAMFSDFSWYNGEIYYNNSYDGEVTEEIEQITQEVNEKIRMSWDVLETDYFHRIEED